MSANALAKVPQPNENNKMQLDSKQQQSGQQPPKKVSLLANSY